MFSSLKPLIYVQISAELLTVKHVRSGRVISEVPEVAIGAPPNSKLLGVGSQARVAASGTDARVVNPFGHPRTLVSDFTVAQLLVKEFIRRLNGKSFMALAPIIVIHPLGSPEGGFTQVENRAFHEMALGAGASKVTVWNGRSLTDQEVLSHKFSQGDAAIG